MAISALIDWEVRTGGSDTNGGGFKSGASGTNRTLQDAAHATLTTAATVHSTTTQLNVPVGEFTVSAADIGNIFQLNSGTATAGAYEITAVDVPNNRWTVDRSLGTAGQTAAGKMGGALASPGKAAGLKVAGNDVWIKAGTYTLTTTTTNVSGGPVNDTVGGIDVTNQAYWIGYDTNRTRFNNDAKPIILVPASGVTTITIFEASALGITFSNITVDGAGKSSIRGFNLYENSGSARAFNCKAQNCTNSGFAYGGEALLVRCEGTGCSVQPVFYGLVVMNPVLWGCYAHDNTVSGFSTNGVHCIHVNCISESNSGGTSHGFTTDGTASSCLWINCTAYNNGGAGFNFPDFFTRTVTWINCLADSNGTFGFATSSADDVAVMLNCAYRNNTSGNVSSNIAHNIGGITLSGDPFVNAPAGDFSLNATSGAGAAARAASYLGAFPGATVTSYLDIGAVQHQDSGGGGGSAETYSGGQFNRGFN